MKTLPEPRKGIEPPTPILEDVDSPKPPRVYLEWVRHWIRQRRGFNTHEYYQEFRLLIWTE